MLGTWDVYFEAQTTKRNFDMRDIGVLEGPPLKSALTIVHTVVALLNVPVAAFLLFDDDKSRVSVRASTSILCAGKSFSSSGSIANRTRTENTTQQVSNMQNEEHQAPEATKLGAAAMITAPVYGPGREPVGALAAIHKMPRRWKYDEIKKLEEQAHLISQEILLRASIQTLRIISSENKTDGALKALQSLADAP